MRIDCKKLEQIRIIRGYKLKEAAEKIGIPPTILKRWEMGKGESPFESGRETPLVLDILRVYDIKVEDLYYDFDLERMGKTDFFDFRSAKRL